MDAGPVLLSGKGHKVAVDMDALDLSSLTIRLSPEQRCEPSLASTVSSKEAIFLLASASSSLCPLCRLSCSGLGPPFGRSPRQPLDYCVNLSGHILSRIKRQRSLEQEREKQEVRTLRGKMKVPGRRGSRRLQRPPHWSRMLGPHKQAPQKPQPRLG
ncbi:hypothetical protein Nepgr_007140 [Nepenthes gracilis]|uniref:Uncharacterized protein n=1 Tax=Nepenthes gracilis TaxID=150966 RepID=A0AAD3S6N0_NEPGR|nr:hypothetical protein Nepgr_007140 [Nepenthes gracilis]